MSRTRTRKLFKLTLIGVIIFTILSMPYPLMKEPRAFADSRPSNLALNGGFEEDIDADGLPDHWTFSNEGQTSASAAIDSGASR
jgi:hypothetical protein